VASVRAARRLSPSLLAAGLVVAACSSGAETSSAPTSSGPAASSSSTAASTSASSWGSTAGCPSVGRALPAGVHTRQTIDVDGDGRPDTEWIAAQPDAGGGTAFGARTASGAVFSATFRSASPVARSVLFADVTGHGTVIALASDGRQVLLYTVSGCRLVPEENPQGGQYAFDLGLTGYGTGVGCADADGDGTRDLLGLKLVPGSGGTPAAVQRTVVELRGAQARNGARSTVASPSAGQAKLAAAITCGDLTMTANGVTTGH
jgi:hypothetical protein